MEEVGGDEFWMFLVSESNVSSFKSPLHNMPLWCLCKMVIKNDSVLTQ